MAREGELRFAAEFTRKGWNVFLPYGDDSSVDLLIEKDGKYKRIQVKSTTPKKEVIVCRLKSSNNWQVKKYTSGDIEEFAIYDAFNKKGYLLSIEDFEGMTEISLRMIKTKNNQEKGIRLAKDFEYF